MSEWGTPEYTDIGVYWQKNTSRYYFIHGLTISNAWNTPATPYIFAYMNDQEAATGVNGWLLKVNANDLICEDAVKITIGDGDVACQRVASTSTYIWTATTHHTADDWGGSTEPGLYPLFGSDLFTNPTIITRHSVATLSSNSLRTQITLSLDPNPTNEQSDYFNASCQGIKRGTDATGDICLWGMVGQLDIDWNTYPPPTSSSQYYTVFPAKGCITKCREDMGWDTGYCAWETLNHYGGDLYHDDDSLYWTGGCFANPDGEGIQMYGYICKMKNVMDNGVASLEVVNEILFRHSAGGVYMIDAAAFQITKDSSSGSYLWATGMVRNGPSVDDSNPHSGMIIKITKEVNGSGSSCEIDKAWMVSHEDYDEFNLADLGITDEYIYVTRNVIAHGALGSDQYLYPHKCFSMGFNREHLESGNAASIVRWVRTLDGARAESECCWYCSTVPNGISDNTFHVGGWQSVMGAQPGLYSGIIGKLHLNPAGTPATPALADKLFEAGAWFVEDKVEPSKMTVDRIDSGATTATAGSFSWFDRDITLTRRSENWEVDSTYFTWGGTGGTVSNIDQYQATLSTTVLTKMLVIDGTVGHDFSNVYGDSSYEAVTFSPVEYADYLEHAKVFFNTWQNSYLIGTLSSLGTEYSDESVVITQVDTTLCAKKIGTYANASHPGKVRTRLLDDGTYFADNDWVDIDHVDYNNVKDTFLTNVAEGRNWLWADFEDLQCRLGATTQGVGGTATKIAVYYWYLLVYFRPFKIMEFDPVGGSAISGGASIRLASCREFTTVDSPMFGQTFTSEELYLRIRRFTTGMNPQADTNTTIPKNLLIDRQISANTFGSVTTEATLKILRNFDAAMQGQTLTIDDVYFIITRYFSARIDKVSTAEDISLKIIRAFQGLVDSQTFTSEIRLINLVQFSSILASISNTPNDLTLKVIRDVTALLEAKVESQEILLKITRDILSTTECSTTTDDILFKVTKSLRAQIGNEVYTDDVRFIIARIFASENIYAESITTDIALKVTKNLQILVTANLDTQENVRMLVERALISSVIAQTISRDITLKVTGFVEFTSSMIASIDTFALKTIVDRNISSSVLVNTSTAEIALSVARQLVADLKAGITTDPIILEIARNFAATLFANSDTRLVDLNLTTFLQFSANMVAQSNTNVPAWLYGMKLSATMAGVTITDEAAITASRVISSVMDSNIADANTALMKVARVLSSEIPLKTETYRIYMVMSVLGLILDPSITSMSVKRSVELLEATRYSVESVRETSVD